MSTGLPAIIFEKIRNDIINGVYPIGTKLPPEREMAQKYGASRFAVREAIAMLAQNCFVGTVPQSGTYVRDFYRDGSLETLVQTLHVRRAIDRQTLDSLLKFRYTTETIAAAEAAEVITTKDLAYLEEKLKTKSKSTGHVSLLAECDYDVHFKIVTVSGNVISRLIFQSFKPIYAFFTEFFYSLPGAAERSLLLNRHLFEALKKRDSKVAFNAMSDILKYGEEKVYEAIDDDEELIIIRQSYPGD
jgi:DNA-binding FadR family transcriptional regulator